MIARPVFSRRFVGRREQLDALLQRFREAAQGSGSIVVVAGEAGMGKTRLLEELSARLSADQVTCAVGRCLEYAQSPFAPFIDVLRGVMRSSSQGPPKDALILADLANLLPELGSTASERFGNVEEERRAQFEAIKQTLDSFAGAAPFVGIIEDLHWADKASLDLMQYLLGSIASSRFMLICSCRVEELAGKHPTRSALARFGRSKQFGTIQLGPLDDTDMHALLDNAMQGRESVSPEILSTIRRLAEGNPLFAEELLKNAIERRSKNADASVEVGLPLTITQAVVERIGQFSPEEYRVLTVAAALGRRFSAEMLSEVTNAPLAELTPILKRARDLQLVLEEPDDDSTAYAFRHALTREAIYGELLAAETLPLHARIATQIESRPDAPARIAELAYHWWLARNYKKAVQYNEIAAAAAEKVYAFGDAAAFYERAIAAAEEQGSVRPELLTKLGGALLYTGSGERSHQAYLRALEHYERSGSVEAIAETCVGYARMCFNLGDLKMAAAMAEKAIRLLGESSENPMYFSAQVMLSFILFREADAPRALLQLEAADHFKGTRSSQDRIAFHNHRAFVREITGDLAGAMSDYQQALDVARRTHNSPYQVRVLGNMALCLSYFGERERSEECAETAIRIARESGVIGFFLVTCLLQYALISLNFGALERARDLIEQILASGVGAMEVQVDAASVGMMVASELEDDDLLGRCERVDLLESAFAGKMRRQIASIARGFVEVYVARHDVERARRLLHRTLEAFKTLPDELEEEILPHVAAHGSEEDIRTARVLLERYVSRVRRPDAQGQALLFEAFAANRAGLKDSATEWGEKAAELYREIRRPNHEALGLELAGKPRDALSLYRETGNIRDAHRVEVELSPRNRRGRSKDELTQREEQVAALIVQGKSNRAIADELVLSERTVESHVASIFHKLNVSSRVELIARIARPTSS